MSFNTIKLSKTLQLIDANIEGHGISMRQFTFLSINWYIWSDCEMWQHIVTAEGVRYLLILIYTYGTQFIKWRKMEGGSKIFNWGRGICKLTHWYSVSFNVPSMSWCIFGRLIKSYFCKEWWQKASEKKIWHFMQLSEKASSTLII